MLRFVPVLMVVLLATELGAQSTPPATLDQAQQRIQYARDQLVAAERKARDADRKEKSAYRQIDLAQQRLDEAQRGYEESKQRAEQATQVLRDVQAEVVKARERYEQEYQYLQEIHRAGQPRPAAPSRCRRFCRRLSQQARAGFAVYFRRFHAGRFFTAILPKS